MRARNALLLLCVLFALTPEARAAAPSSVFIEDLTWTELRERSLPARRRSSCRSAAPSRTGRTWRSASTMRGSRALAERIAAALGNALVAPVVAYVPEGGVAPPTGAHALSRDDHRARCRVREDARIRGAQLSPARIPRHRVPRRPRRLPEGPESRRRPRSNREWAATPVRVHAVDEYYRAAESRFREAAGKAGATATTRSARTRRSPIRRWRWRSNPQTASARTSCNAAGGGRARALRRPAPRERRARPGRRRSDRRGNRRRHSQTAVAKR